MTSLRARAAVTKKKEVRRIEIRVLNKRLVGNRGEYVGRPSPLGNPFKLERESDRESVIEWYEVWLREKIRTRDKAVCDELNRLFKIARDSGVLELACWCAPKLCHAEVIRCVLLEQLSKLAKPLRNRKELRYAHSDRPIAAG